MVAGTPTSAGSIIDVEKHIGEMLIGIGKAEAVVEAEAVATAQPAANKPSIIDAFTNALKF